MDLGSGRRLDCFIAFKTVGIDGKVFGIDSSRTMVQKLPKLRRKITIQTAPFFMVNIEHISLPKTAIDFVMSNCVINLSSEKEKYVYRIRLFNKRHSASFYRN